MSQFKNLLISHSQQVQEVSLHDWFIYAFFRARGLAWFIDPEYKLSRQHNYPA
jgi:rhamnosyltransferase